MARACPAGERTLLGGQALGQHLKVEVQNASGTWVDLTTAGGVNWVDAVEIDESIDQQVASLVLTLRAEHGALSLNPLRTDSTMNRDDLDAYAPLIFGGRRVRVWTGASLPYAAVPSTPWRLIFYGVIDEPAASPIDGGRDNDEQLIVQGRDLGAVLLDKFPEQPRTYSTIDGEDVEVVMQQIVQDNIAGTSLSIVLVLPDGSPNWRVKQFVYDGTIPVLEELRNLAQQIGWDVRYRFDRSDPDPNTLQLEFFDPDRAKTTPDFTLGPSEYLSVDDFRFGDRNVRNVVGIWFYDANAGGALTYRSVEDAASISVYGRRFMQIAEAYSSNIDTETEALAMINAALSDLSTPYVDHKLTAFDLWFAQLGDLIELPANDVHYNEDQAFAIVGLHRSWAQGAGTIAVHLRGKPGGAYSEWIRKHGRGPSGRGIPAPFFGVPLGEGSEGGGVSGDGMVWMEVGFEPGTLFVDVYVEERESNSPVVPVPEVGEITRAWRLYRQLGKVAQDLYWRTWLGMATRPDYWKRIRAYGYNAAGDAGPEYIADPVQARDPAVAIVDGVINTLTVSRSQFGCSVTVDVASLDPTAASFVMIMRNGIIIAPLFVGVQPGAVPPFFDEDLDPAGTYTYEVFVWTQGVSGAHVSALAPPIAAPPALPPVDTIDWIDPDPSVIFRLVNSAFTQATRARYVHNAAAIVKVALQASADGSSGWADVAQRVSTENYGEIIYASVIPQWFRLRGANADDSLEYFSEARLLVHKVKPPPAPGTIPRMVNGGPRLNAAGDAVLIDYVSNMTGFDHIVLESSTDYVTWSDVSTLTTATGQFSHASLTAKYYRLRAEDVANALLAYSYAAYWNGVIVPAPDSPPVILPGYPQVVDVGGIPTMQLGYTSNISWFAKMWLQASGDGSTWSNVTMLLDAAGIFEYATASAQWFRVLAHDSANTRSLYSTAVYFPGLAPPGSDTSAPDFTLAVMQVGGEPRLVVSWTCTNGSAVKITIETSEDNGVGFGWVERAASAAVRSGAWQLGDYREETYYRVVAKDVSDLVLAIAPAQYWAGQVLTA